ncbi:MAG: hypothetical protein A2X47_13470 [Lentisphaerae bacterium GWF2_38_69]|nr:MAG: hypothetical protein A2X47_13470 [Lentisphaerae bacterium GWF2_38_69]
MKYDIAVIGAGVVGSAIARELSKYELKVILIDKEEDVSEGISKANSGVIHAGFNVKTGSMKSRFNREGLALLTKTADELGVKYKICRKLVIAKNDEEKPYLLKLLEQGRKNSTPGLSIIDRETIKTLESNIEGKWALYSEKTGIITPFLFTIALAENACENGVIVKLNTEITKITKEKESYKLFSASGELISESRWVINSAGCASDNIASLVGDNKFKIHPCRGEYFILDKAHSDMLNMAVYPVPPADGSGLGVHFTPTMNGNILIGPSAEYINDRDDLATTKKTMEQLKKEAYELMPIIKNFGFIKSYAGIRPKLFNSQSNSNFEDFHIAESDVNPRFINLIGIESPGLTSSPAIARYIVEDIIGEKEDLTRKKEFDGRWKGAAKIYDKNSDEYLSLVKRDSDYAQVVCRCEHVTKGEIKKALNNPLKARSLKAVKKRTFAMTGRCQGGFCLSKLIDILQKEYSIKTDEILRLR